MYYHASNVANIKELIPGVSMHGKPFVYLTTKRENALVYLSNAVEDIGQPHFIRPVEAELPFQKVRFRIPFMESHGTLPGRIFPTHPCPDPCLAQQTADLADGKGLTRQRRHQHVDLADPFLIAFITGHCHDCFQIPLVKLTTPFLASSIATVIQCPVNVVFEIPTFKRICLRLYPPG